MITDTNWIRKGTLAFSHDSTGHKFWCVIVSIRRDSCYTMGGTNGATHACWDFKSQLKKATEEEIIEHMRLQGVPEEVTRSDIIRIRRLVKDG